MKKTIKIFIFLAIAITAILSGLYIFSDHDTEKTSVSSSSKCPYFENYIKTEAKYTYTNTTIGFSIQVPKGWYVATANDIDPRMYNCDNEDGGPSFGIY